MRNTITKPLAVSILLASAVFAHAQTVTGSIPLPALPEQVAVNPLTNRVYATATNFGALPYDYLTVINGRKDTVITNIEIPPVAYAIAVDPFRDIIYVGGAILQSDGSNTGSEVVAINGRRNKVIETIPVTSTTSGNGIQGLAVNWITGDLYVANGSDDEVDVIDHFHVTARIAVGGVPYGVAVNQRHGTVYASLSDVGGVVLIDPKTNAMTTTTAFGTSGAGITVDQETGDVFTTNSVSSPNVAQVGALGSAGNLLATIPVGNIPVGIDADFGSHLVFVANTGDDDLSVIDGKTDAVTATLPVSSLFLSVNSLSGKVYIAPQDPVAALTVLTEHNPDELVLQKQ
jgi:YVTN family beta-propeller protein